MVLFSVLWNRIHSRGILRNVDLNMMRKQFLVSPSTMLHSKAIKPILKTGYTPFELQTPEKRAVTISRYFSTSRPLAAGRNYANTWKVERVLSLSLLGLLPSIFYYSSQELEAALAVITSLHSYLGMHAITEDYAQPKNVGVVGSYIFSGLLLCTTIIILSGLLNIIYNDVGLAELLRMFWKLDTNETVE